MSCVGADPAGGPVDGGLPRRRRWSEAPNAVPLLAELRCGEAVAFRRRPCFVRDKLNRGRQAFLEDWLGRGSDSRSVG
jgi:hypothetical protein